MDDTLAEIREKGTVIEGVLEGLLAAACGGGAPRDDRLSSLTQAQWESLWDLARLHQVEALVLGELAARGLHPPETVQSGLAAYAKETELRFYTLFSLTSYAAALLRKAGLPFYVLKGVSLCALYPHPERRLMSDVDLYVPGEENWLSACRVLHENGFVLEHPSVLTARRGAKDKPFYTYYHMECRYAMRGGMRTLELHRKPSADLPDSAAERRVREIFSLLPGADACRLLGVDLPVLPVQAFAFSLVLHMTQHFLFAGFGLRLLCDWTVFLRRHGCALGAPFLSFVRETGLDRFTAAVTRLCTAHLGLREEEVPWLGLLQAPRPEGMERLWADILAGGDFGKGEKGRMLLPAGGGRLHAYLSALQLQASRRYPGANRIVPLRPLLWCGAAWMFLRGNRKERGVHAAEVFRSAGSRRKLLTDLALFEKARAERGPES